MKRPLLLIGATLLAVSTSFGPAGAQDSAPVNADGSYVVANDESPSVSGRGDDLSYGDINTGGGSGEVLGDPSAIYTPILPDRDTLMTMPGAGDGMIGGVPIQPAAPDATTTTTTSLANNSGTTTENVPIAASTNEPAPIVADEGTAATGFCSQYSNWYDAQVAYENLGGTAADQALVQEIDSDFDGIACEGLMV